MAEQGKFERFKLLRKILGMTQNQLAELVGVKRPFITMLERGNRWVDNRTLFLIEQKVGVSADWLESGRGLLFADSKKGLTLLKHKNRIDNKYEAYFVFSLVQQVYSQMEFETRKEFLYRLLDCLEYVCENSSIPFGVIKSCWGAVGGENLKETLNNIKYHFDTQAVAHENIMDHVARCFCGIFQYIEDKEDLPDNVYDKLNELLIPYLFHVCQAYITQKDGFEPLSSIFFDIEPDKVNTYLSLIDRNQQKQHLNIKNKDVTLWGYYSASILSFEKKAYIELSCEQLFCLLSLCINVHDDATLKGLDFEVFKSDIDKTFQIKQRNINLVFTIEEYKALLEVVDALKQIEGGKLWQWMQARFIDKYGFV